MPTYEYKCTAEGSTFEIWQEVGAAAPACPDCGAPSKKVFAPPRVIFKGSGFYVTDLRSEQNAKKGVKTDEAKVESSSASSEKSSSTTESAASSPAPAPAPSAPASTPTKA